MPSTSWQSSFETLLLRRWSWALVDLRRAAESVCRELDFMMSDLLLAWSSMAKYVCTFAESDWKSLDLWPKEGGKVDEKCDDGESGKWGKQRVDRVDCATLLATYPATYPWTVTWTTTCNRRHSRRLPNGCKGTRMSLNTFSGKYAGPVPQGRWKMQRQVGVFYSSD